MGWDGMGYDLKSLGWDGTGWDFTKIGLREITMAHLGAQNVKYKFKVLKSLDGMGRDEILRLGWDGKRNLNSRDGMGRDRLFEALDGMGLGCHWDDQTDFFA